MIPTYVLTSYKLAAKLALMYFGCPYLNAEVELTVEREAHIAEYERNRLK